MRGIKKFNSILQKITSKNKLDKSERLDISKIEDLSKEERLYLVEFLVAKRTGVVMELIPKDYDFQALASRGYLYCREKNGYKFLCCADALVNMGIL